MIADTHISQLLDTFLTRREDEVLEFKEAKYVQNKAFDNDYYKKLLLTYLEEWGTTSRSKINALIENKPPDFLTPEQKRKKIANLLLRLKQAGKITLTERNEWKLIQNSN